MKNTEGYYAAAFASLREELIAEAAGGTLTDEEIVAVVKDRILPNIDTARRIQALHAKLNCTHLSLLPGVKDVQRAWREWRKELASLELMLEG